MWWRHIFIRFTQTRHNFISAAKLAFPNLRHRQPETSSNDGILHRAYDQANEFKTGVHSLFFSFNGFEAIETFKESNGQWFWSALMWTKTSLQCFTKISCGNGSSDLLSEQMHFDPHVPKPSAGGQSEPLPVSVTEVSWWAAPTPPRICRHKNVSSGHKMPWET